MPAMLCSRKSFAQAFAHITVIDSLTRQPLESATLSIKGSGNDAVTDNTGRAELRLPESEGRITASMIVYKAASIAFTGTKPIVIELARDAVDLSAVTVTTRPGGNAFHTVSSIDINLRPVNSSQDLMRLVPGLFLGQHQGGGIAEHIFFRGFDADHGSDVSVSVDDMPLNLVSHAHGQGFSDLHFLIPELVNKFDFGKGPYYADHGDFATAGYVSFQTRDVPDHSEVKLEGGQFHTGRVMAVVKLLSDKALQNGESAYLAGEAAYTDGPFDAPQKFSRENLFGKYLVNLSPKSKLRLTASHFYSQWNSSGEIPEHLVDAAIFF